MAEKKPEKKPNIFMKVFNFFKDSKNEIKKIIWPTPGIVFKNTGVVLVMILVVGVFVFFLDTVFIKLLGMIMSVSNQ